MRRFSDLRTFLVCSLILGCLPLPVFAQQGTEWAMKMFEETSHNFGVVASGSEVQHRLKMTNIYLETVHISSVKTSCGCTAAKPSQDTLKSLETAYIEISMDTRKFSRQKDSSVIITIDAPQYAEVRIPISAYIRTDVVTEPGSVNFGSIDRGVGASRQIAISYAGRPDWRILQVENLPNYLTADVVETSRQGGTIGYNLTVNLKDSCPVGTFRGLINLITDDASNPRVPLLVEGEVVSDISVNPPLVLMGTLTPGQKKTANVIIRGKTPFKVTKVEAQSDLNAFQVQLPEVAKPVHVIPLTIITPDGSGTIVEEFIVTIDGRDDPITFKATCNVVPGT